VRQLETVIIGGGIAGLACARQLQRAGRDFLLISDRLGGRLHATADGLNFGAAYITTDYRHVAPFVDRGARIYMKDVCYWDRDRYITLFHPRNIRRAPAVARLYALVYAFRRRFLRLRRQAPQLCQKTLMERDPVLRQATTQPADAFVRQHGLEEITEVFCGPIFHSTLFLPYTESNAFYYLANLFPIWLPTYAVDIRPAVGRLSAGFEERIVVTRALEVEERPGGSFVVRTADARYGADNLVLALPGRNSRDLLPVQNTARDIPYCTIHIRGRRRREAAPGKTIFLSSDQPVRILWPQHNGVDIAFTDRVDPDLTPFYEHHEITDAVRWKTAVQLSDGRWRPLQPRPNLFTIGDHNICGLEDSYLTGLFAANRIAR
jgi:glycine/D-amino acid oxidase-like deaminating enzyme